MDHITDNEDDTVEDFDKLVLSIEPLTIMEYLSQFLDFYRYGRTDIYLRFLSEKMESFFDQILMDQDLLRCEHFNVVAKGLAQDIISTINENEDDFYCTLIKSSTKVDGRTFLIRKLCALQPDCMTANMDYNSDDEFPVEEAVVAPLRYFCHWPKFHKVVMKIKTAVGRMQPQEIITTFNSISEFVNDDNHNVMYFEKVQYKEWDFLQNFDDYRAKLGECKKVVKDVWPAEYNAIIDKIIHDLKNKNIKLCVTSLQNDEARDGVDIQLTKIPTMLKGKKCKKKAGKILLDSITKKLKLEKKSKLMQVTSERLKKYLNTTEESEENGYVSSTNISIEGDDESKDETDTSSEKAKVPKPPKKPRKPKPPKPPKQPKKPKQPKQPKQPKISKSQKRKASADAKKTSHSKIIEDMSVPLESDKAIRMMRLMGWQGGALGARGNGITEPIMPALIHMNREGLGLKPTAIVQPRRSNIDCPRYPLPTPNIETKRTTPTTQTDVDCPRYPLPTPNIETRRTTPITQTDVDCPKHPLPIPNIQTKKSIPITQTDVDCPRLPTPNIQTKRTTPITQNVKPNNKATNALVPKSPVLPFSFTPFSPFTLPPYLSVKQLFSVPYIFIPYDILQQLIAVSHLTPNALIFPNVSYMPNITHYSNGPSLSTPNIPKHSKMSSPLEKAVEVSAISKSSSTEKDPSKPNFQLEILIKTLELIRSRNKKNVAFSYKTTIFPEQRRFIQTLIDGMCNRSDKILEVCGGPSEGSVIQNIIQEMKFQPDVMVDHEYSPNRCRVKIYKWLIIRSNDISLKSIKDSAFRVVILMKLTEFFESDDQERDIKFDQLLNKKQRNFAKELCHCLNNGRKISKASKIETNMFMKLERYMSKFRLDFCIGLMMQSFIFRKTNINPYSSVTQKSSNYIKNKYSANEKQSKVKKRQNKYQIKTSEDDELLMSKLYNYACDDIIQMNMNYDEFVIANHEDDPRLENMEKEHNQGTDYALYEDTNENDFDDYTLNDFKESQRIVIEELHDNGYPKEYHCDDERDNAFNVFETTEMVTNAELISTPEEDLLCRNEMSLEDFKNSGIFKRMLQNILEIDPENNDVPAFENDVLKSKEEIKYVKLVGTHFSTDNTEINRSLEYEISNSNNIQSKKYKKPTVCDILKATKNCGVKTKKLPRTRNFILMNLVQNEICYE